MERLNNSTARDDVAARDTVADVYRTSIEYVKCMKLLVERLIKMLSYEDKFYAMNRHFVQHMAFINIFSQPSELEASLEKQNEVVSLLKNISGKDTKMSEFKGSNPYINVTT
jgi:hypothetical protein